MKQLLQIIPLAATVMVACADDSPSPSETQESEAAVSVEDGILHFATSQAYFDYGLKMANMNPNARIKLEENLGFISMQTYAEGLLSDVDANEPALLARPELFSYSADTVDDALMVSADIEVPAAIAVAANADGLYYIGDVVYKVDRYNQASVRGGDALAVSRVLAGEVEADGETSNLFRYDLSGSSLKSSSVQIEELKGKMRNNSLWTDYTAKVYINKDVDDDGLSGIIYFQQKTKNYKKKHLRWREHRNGNAFRYVSVRISHPSVSETSFAFPDYFGENLVNHSYTREIKRIPKYGNNSVEENPYIKYIEGRVCSDGIDGGLDLNTLFTSESQKQ